MKFKVGDKVKLNKNKKLFKYGKGGVSYEEIGSIKSINGNILTISFPSNNFWEGVEDELELVKYTYEDLKKAPIGTKVTFENGEVFVKDDKETYENRDKGRDEIDFVKMEDRFGTLGKIIKIEEPVYNTVYEDKQNILTETEKNYLKIVIGPVKDKVLNITKTQQRTYTARKFIDIEIQDDDCICLSFIDENSELSYKGMKTEHPYTLQELGL